MNKTTTGKQVYAEYWSRIFEKWMSVTVLGHTAGRAQAKEQIKEYTKRYGPNNKFRIVTIKTTETIEEIR